MPDVFPMTAGCCSTLFPEDLDDRRVDQSRRNKGRGRGSQPTTSHPDGFNWEVLVVHEPVVNARAFLDGKIAVFTGLLEHFRKDAEVATVIAHEMAHVVARHAAEEVTKDLWFTFLEQILGMFAKPDRVNTMSSHHLWHPLNRKLEIEADHIGLLLMASAGYDPWVAPKVYEELDKVNGYAEAAARRGGGGGEGCRSLSLHPCGNERAQLLAQAPVFKEALTLYRNSTPSNGHAYR
ncbi:hypothetical protein NL676_016349 [Syzygium grande]|nr:hypothetical protein NL676_016349 [Syzygium grande]